MSNQDVVREALSNWINQLSKCKILERMWATRAEFDLGIDWDVAADLLYGKHHQNRICPEDFSDNECFIYLGFISAALMAGDL